MRLEERLHPVVGIEAIDELPNFFQVVLRAISLNSSMDKPSHIPGSHHTANTDVSQGVYGNTLFPQHLQHA